jgi:hypothetical protein
MCGALSDIIALTYFKISFCAGISPHRLPDQFIHWQTRLFCSRALKLLELPVHSTSSDEDQPSQVNLISS